MRVLAELVPIETRLQPGVSNSQRTWNERRGLLLRLSTPEGIGVGECSPLPGYSPDSLEECEAALRALPWQSLVAFDARLSPEAALARASALLPRELPAARFALESALLDLWSRTRRTPACVFLDQRVEAHRPLRVSRLLGPAANTNLVSAALSAHEHGFRCLKFKIGVDFEREFETLSLVRDKLGDLIQLRADVNRAWPSQRAAAYLERLSTLRLEFVEEPSAEPSAWPRLSNVPLALDESLQGLDLGKLDAMIADSGAQVMVLKPTVLGGFSSVIALNRKARSRGLRTIISHTFEGPIGHAACVQLALVCQSSEVATGFEPESVIEPGIPPARLDTAGQWHRRPDEPGLGAFDREQSRRFKPEAS